MIIMLILYIILAILPSIVLSVYVYKKDYIEKEPISMLLILFLLGVVITIPVSLLENSISYLVNFDDNNLLHCFIKNFFVVAAVEEGYKYLVTYTVSWNSKNFDHIFDGIVYATFTSLGFATLENILYIIISLTNNGTTEALRTCLLRALVSVPGHAFYAVASGYYLGLAKYYKTLGYQRNKRIFIAMSIIVPIIIHGTFDFLLVIDNKYILVAFFAFVGVLYLMSYLKIRNIYKTQMTLKLKGSEDNE